MKRYNLLLIAMGWALASCEAYLDVKPSKAIDTPDSIEAVEALLDNAETMNYFPTQSVVMGDEFVADDQAITSMDLLEQNFYLWMPRPFELTDQVFDWRDLYNQIQIANVALESLEKLDQANSKVIELRGTALFYRAFAYYNLSTLFLEGANLQRAGITQKIPIRRGTSMVLKPELADRQTIRDLIKTDLEEAVTSLPGQTPYLSRPSRQAGFALLARVCLDWGDFERAKEAAERAIALGGRLLDFKSLNRNATYPIPRFSSEVIWLGRVGGTSYFNSQSGFQISPDLLSLYKGNDLRRDLFYITRSNGFVNYRGSYLSGRPLFGGLSLNETYLIYAESLVRIGALEQGAGVLNFLLQHRMRDGWTRMDFTDESQALGILIEERRKELPFRGLRWADLRRFNGDERYQQTLSRTFEGITYELGPNSEKYILPIPARELQFY